MTENNDFNLPEHLFPLTRNVERLYDRFCRISGVSGRAQSQLLSFLTLETPKRTIFQKDVETVFNIRPSSATALLKALENRGLIRREQTGPDGRYKKIIMTERSLPFQQQSLEIHQELQNIMLKNIAPEDLEAFKRICEQVKLNIAEIK